MAESGYDHIIDAETRAFIKRTEAYYSGDTSTMTIAGQRAAYDAMCRDFHQGRPAGITVKDRPLAGRPARHYTCAQAADADTSAARIIYFHGGGFVVGSLDSHDDVCAEICARSRLDVIAIEYRLAPEHPFPAGVEDAIASLRAAADNQLWLSPDLPLVVGGDSAGGGGGDAGGGPARTPTGPRTAAAKTAAAKCAHLLLQRVTVDTGNDDEATNAVHQDKSEGDA